MPGQGGQGKSTGRQCEKALPSARDWLLSIHMQVFLRRGVWVLAALICQPVSARTLFSEAAVVKLHGKPIASSYRSFAREGNLVRTEIRFVMKVKRFGEVLEMNRTFTCLEDEAGRVQSFRLVNNQSQVASELKGRREGNEFVIDRIRGSSVSTVRRVVPDALAPWRAFEEDRARRLSPGLTYRQTVFQVTTEDDLTNTYSHRVVERVKHTYNGRPVDAFLVMATPEPEGKPERHIVGADGLLYLQELPEASTSVEKVDETRIASDEPEDIFSLLAVQMEGRVRFPRDARRVHMEVTSTRALPPAMQTEYQAVNVRERGGERILSIRSIRRTTSSVFQSRPNPVYLGPEESIDPADPEIMKKAAEITRGAPDALSKIRKINKWVFENIKKKDYSVAYASASEVIRNLQGDCTEHSVLFVALARAAGVPARIVHGLAYMNDNERGPLLVLHQWAEAYAGGWIPVDPTFGLLPADAARIVISRPVPNERRGTPGIMEWGPHIRVKIVRSR